MNSKKIIVAILAVVIISSTSAVSVFTAKPEEPNIIEAIWSAITNLINTKADVAPDYDSGWIDIGGMAGQNIVINNLGLNPANARVYITGKTALDGDVHQRLGLVNPMLKPGFTKSYAEEYQSVGSSVIQTLDGGYAIIGYNATVIGPNVDMDVLLIKTDASGRELWNKTYGGAGKQTGNSIIQTSDGGYAILGTTDAVGLLNSDAWLIKTDAYGNELWNKTYGGDDADAGNSIIQTSDGGYAIVGYYMNVTFPTVWGPRDVWLIKTDAAGTMIWDKTYGGVLTDGRPSDDVGFSMVQTSDGGYTIAAETWYSSSGAGLNDIWLIKTDAAGTMIWDKLFGGPNNDSPGSFIQTIDGGYAIAGTTGAGLNADAWLIKTDAYGNELWNRTYGGAGQEAGNSIIQTSDGGYAIAGATWTGTPDAWLLKTDANGKEIWNKTFGGSYYGFAFDVIQTIDGGYAITGQIEGQIDYWDVLLATFNPTDESGLAWIDSTANSITLYRGYEDTYWNWVRVQIWDLG